MAVLRAKYLPYAASCFEVFRAIISGPTNFAPVPISESSVNTATYK